MYIKKKKMLNLLLLLISITILLYIIFNINQIKLAIDLLSEGNINDLVIYIRSFGLLAPLLSIVLMILQAFLAPIPSFLIAGANGIIFGVMAGVFISWLGAMLGAIGTFYLSRSLGNKFIAKNSNKNKLLKQVNQISSQHGFKIILFSRLIPFVSFDFISYAAGLSKITLKDFTIATAIGMLPGTFLYVILGSSLLKTNIFTLPATILVILLFYIYLLLKHFRK